MESNFSRAQLCICGGPDAGKKLAGECISRFEFGGVRGGGGGGNGVTRFFFTCLQVGNLIARLLLEMLRCSLVWRENFQCHN